MVVLVLSYVEFYEYSNFTNEKTRWDELNNLPRSRRFGKNGRLGIKSGTQIFFSLNSLCCTPFHSLVTLGISSYSHKVICCIWVHKENVCVCIQIKYFICTYSNKYTYYHIFPNPVFPSIFSYIIHFSAY